MDPRQLRRFFLAAISTATACSGSTAEATGPRTPSAARDTVDPTTARSLAPTRYVGLRAAGDMRAGFGGDTSPAANGPIVAEHGAACAEVGGPRDATANCPPEVRAVLAMFGTRSVVLLTDQGPATAIADAAGIVRAFGAIDSPAKAALVAWVAGYDIFSATAPGVARVHAGADGFRVFAERDVIDAPPCAGPESSSGTRTHLRVQLLVRPDGSVAERSPHVLSRMPYVQDCHPLGRRPEGLADRTCDGTAGDYFARAAYLEAASVGAFERLARELHAHGAPATLLQHARCAADDERRHARTMARFARRFGGRLQRAPRGPHAIRSLAEVAAENAVEGCVGETFAALVATYQSRHAVDPAVRAAFETIAHDETRHAALAHAVARWAEPRLADADAAHCRNARDMARDALADGARKRHRDAASAFAGEPEPAVAGALCDALIALHTDAMAPRAQ